MTYFLFYQIHFLAPKKKNKANAFSMFIYDQMDKRRMHMSFQQAVVQLTPKWKVKKIFN